MADAAVSFLLENVAELLRPQRNNRIEIEKTNYSDPISAAKSKLPQIQNEFEQLKTFLRGAAGREGEQFREIERQIREVLHDAEDTIYCFEMQEEAAKAINFFRRHSFNRKQRLSLAKELISFRQDCLASMLRKARVMLDEMQTGLESSISVGKQPTKEKEVPSFRQNNIVGFKAEADTLINYLMEETEELDVISITGMPGIGKTTLARKICQNDKVRAVFGSPIWVHVSQEFHWRNVLLSILHQLMKEYMSWMNDQDLALAVPEYLESRNMYWMNDQDLTRAVREHLESRNFLLVMDAVWTADALKSILDILPEKTKMGKVLITSRNNNVCVQANVTRKPHILRFLNHNESWEMLQSEVGKLDNCSERLKSIGEDIAKKCDGLPLAIEVIGSSLVVASSTGRAEELTEQWWKKVSENVTMYVKEYEQQRISGSVALSYYKLSIQLRNCFLYFGMFPEDYEISAWTLTRLWIAEGFIYSNEGKSLEEIAEQNLIDLVDSNLVMVNKISPDGKVKTCHVHKMIHGFCKSKAAELNFFQEIKMSKEGVFDHPVSLAPNYRRLCIYSHLSEFLSSKPSGPGVRSFLCLDKDQKNLDSKCVSAMDKSFNLLRILESIKFTEFPITLSKLIHLRYISLSSDDLNALPETMSELCNLETLVVNTRSPSLVIKANIWRMIQLRHLVTKAAIILAMDGEGESGQNLQTLSKLSPEYCTDAVFKRSCNLKRLGIRGKLATLSNAESLKTMDCLENLKLVNDSASNNQLFGLLRPNCFPPNLKSLTLSATYLNWDDMSILGNIVTLKFLKLKNNAFIGESWNTDANGFRCLEFLFIKTTNLVSWEAPVGCFPRLKSLVLRNCGKLKKIPLSKAKSLEKLDIDHVTKSAVECAREIKEESTDARTSESLIG